MSTTFNALLRGLSHSTDSNFVFSGGRRLIEYVALAWRIRRERNQLMGLDERTLSDIGVYPRDAEIEARRGLTDLPKCRLPRS